MFRFYYIRNYIRNTLIKPIIQPLSYTTPIISIFLIVYNINLYKFQQQLLQQFIYRLYRLHISLFINLILILNLMLIELIF